MGSRTKRKANETAGGRNEAAVPKRTGDL